ncbi:MAG: beta-lactamase family protein [Actinomycetia bacterium]|nr:beta-lactamase family protein [Actinomycetes bacterium]MCP4959852.1 beta-lactamase family protein [Actinomycetes bacterium]
MDELIDRVLERGVDSGAVPGVSAHVVGSDGPLYEGAAGVRTVGSDAAMTPDTVCSIHSMTKAITGVAAMQLVERGALDLDATASSVCDEMGPATVLVGFGPDGEPVLRRATTEPTLRQLLTHTSGYGYDIWDRNLDRWYTATDTPRLGTRRLAALDTPLMFDPGTRWQYGIGIDWVGRMIERISGATLGAYFEEHVTGPLGMADTRFTPTPSMNERRASVHARQADGSLIPIHTVTPEQRDFEAGGGDLLGTGADYARFVRMILNDGELDGMRVLEAETVGTMARNHIGDLRVTRLVPSSNRLSNEAEFFPGEPKSWGLTFQVNETAAPTGRSEGTLMWAGLANSFFWIDRSHGIGGVFMSQILPFADRPALDLFYEVERSAYSVGGHR